VNRFLAAAAVAGILASGSARAVEANEWCKSYGVGTTYVSPQWNSCASNFLYVFMTEEQLDNGMHFSPDKIEVKECKTVIKSPVALCKIYTYGDTTNGMKIKMNLAYFPSDDKSWIVVGWEAFP
jgi:uncharacterized cupredoxin-like copper-binding protein